MTDKPNKSTEDLKKELSPESFYVTQESGTERPFTGQYWDHVEDGEEEVELDGVHQHLRSELR